MRLDADECARFRAYALQDEEDWEDYEKDLNAMLVYVHANGDEGVLPARECVMNAFEFAWTLLQVSTTWAQLKDKGTHVLQSTAAAMDKKREIKAKEVCAKRRSNACGISTNALIAACKRMHTNGTIC